MATNQTIVLSRDVINTIQSLPFNQQLSIVSAIAGELILGEVVSDELTAEEMRLYSVIKNNVKRDSHLYACHVTGL